MFAWLCRALLVALVLVVSVSAKADPTKPHAVFALVVTSNHGASGARPDLHYADDDGIKYFELFRMLGGDANVVLHTDLDRDTARLYPWAREAARAPSRAAVEASIATLQTRIDALTKAGGTSEFYFVFAGHGDVDAGTGYLELVDSRFTSNDVESMLRRLAPTHAHVILDSCNSFFVLNARRPGGRPVATTADEAKSLGERLPNVGVFLSTSSAAEVFEWSELQAGIFSHAVRSGLAGAADANGDGEISYAELRAFVSVASARIKNPLYRPQVFARGPASNPAFPILRFANGRGRALRIDGPRVRLTVLDADEVPMVDLHKEEGAVVTLRLPERWVTHAAIDERNPSEQGRVARRFMLEGGPSESPIALASLAAREKESEARGASEMFRTLFEQPFGPRAMIEETDELRREDADAVYGVSADEVVRLRTLLAQASSNARGKRITLGAGYLSFGAVLGGGGVWLATRDDDATKAYPYYLLGYGALLGTLGVVSLVRPSSEERLYAAYLERSRSTDPAVRAAAVADAESTLFRLRDRDRVVRQWLRVASLTLLGTSAALFALNEVKAGQENVSCVTIGGANNCVSTPEISSDAAWSGRLVTGSLFALGLTAAVASFVPTSTERLADIWASDPTHVRLGEASLRPSMGLAPTRGGAQLSLAWTF